MATLVGKNLASGLHDGAVDIVGLLPCGWGGWKEIGFRQLNLGEQGQWFGLRLGGLDALALGLHVPFDGGNGVGAVLVAGG